VLADFKLRPLPGSKFHFRIRIWDTQEAMEATAVACGAMTGTAQACFCGHQLGETINNHIGDVYLYASPSIWADAVHELTHAAVHYTRELRKGDLSEPNNGEYASAAEELLCRVMENLVVEMFVQLARFKNEGVKDGVNDPLDNRGTLAA
jgi:hypothetical protein